MGLSEEGERFDRTELQIGDGEKPGSVTEGSRQGIRVLLLMLFNHAVHTELFIEALSLINLFSFCLVGAIIVLFSESED